jgi:hypothetical protein
MLFNIVSSKKCKFKKQWIDPSTPIRTVKIQNIDHIQSWGGEQKELSFIL